MRQLILIGLISLVVTAGAPARVPHGFNYQGLLANPGGTPLDTTVAMVFNLYADSSGGSPVWTENHLAVTVTDGLFNTRIGWTVPIPESVLDLPQLWLAVTVGNNSEMTPRVRVVAVPYAMRSFTSDSVTADNLGDLLQLWSQIPDADRDGHNKMSMGGDDCDDLDPNVYAGALETCDGKDNDCDHAIDDGFSVAYYRDADHDGYGVTANQIFSCAPPDTGWSPEPGDCDDSDPARHPGATEVCDGIDGNCDGLNDTDIMQTFCIDSDSDGFGMSGGPGCIQACTQPEGHVPNGEDCDDSNPQIHPGATEVCDGLDNDCDGQIDPQGTQGCTNWWLDLDGDGYGDTFLGCYCENPGEMGAPQPGDCDDSQNTVSPGAPEICDGQDNDCDGEIDEDGGTAWYADADADGFGDPNNSVVACTAPNGYVADNTDCNDSNAQVHPGAPEICNGIDDDCNGFPEANGSFCPPNGACQNGVCVQFP